MIVILGFLAGIAYGAWLAGKRGGKMADRAQYAAGFGIFFGLLALFATILIENLA